MSQAAIHRLHRQDLPAYQALMLAGVAAHPDRFRLTAGDIEAEWPPLEADPDAFTLLAEIGGVMAGVVSVRREARHKCRHKALLYRMLVGAAWAGQGVGRLLLEQSIAQARAIEGLRHLNNLTVLADNAAARRLYASAGFVEFACEPEAVFADGRYRDEIEMKRNLVR